jgi:hypothetical protein
MAIRKSSDEPVSRYEFMQAWSARRKAGAQQAMQRSENARNSMSNIFNTTTNNMVLLTETILRNNAAAKVDKKA